ncbi:QacE family quaternary ammonium compound efflux SMR transporter [Rhodococcus hoagii]|nr:QacE family quaternary ammonium compound efflux SMR transporter [Prescottella equi]NKS30338.1 QacE family quaternary ammonium compound efflux SMR transporter [Prescottella equi]
MTWILLVAAIVVEVAGTLCLKASGGGRRRWWLLPTAAAYVAAFGLIAVVLDRGMAVGVVYGIWVACGVALTAILGRVIFRDPLTPRMGLGIALIIAGVLVIELGAASAA